MADEQPKNPTQTKSASGGGAKSHLVYVQAPYGVVDLGDNLRYTAEDSPYEVTAEEAKVIQEAATAHGVTNGGLVVVENKKE